jgi:hypothetical protein
MKYLFVIYTDLEYEHHLDNFKKQEFYRQLHLNNRPTDPHIEVIEWGADFHTDYKDLPIKTQQMMKWCSENKEYDYLIKCDDTIFEEKWMHYSDRLTYESIFKNDDIEYRWKWGDQHLGFNPELDKLYSNGVWGRWDKIEQISKHYRGINLLELDKRDWTNFENYHDSIEYLNLNFIPNDIPFFEGKFYMVSKDLSIFIGGQEKLAKDMAKNMPGVEDLMVGYLTGLF